MSPIQARAGLLEMVAGVGELTAQQRNQPLPRMSSHQVGRLTGVLGQGKELRSQLARGF